MRGIPRVLLRPLARGWAANAERVLRDVPRPTDGPQAYAVGADSDRILLFGSGPVVGWGVLTHNLALSGALARALSRRTGRGVNVDVTAEPQIIASTALDALDDAKLWRYDAVVVAVGEYEATSLASLRDWERRLRDILVHVTQASSRGTEIFVIGSQPYRTIRIYSGLFGRFAEQHGLAMDRISVRLCAEFERVSFVAFSPEATSSPGRYRSSADYRAWAEILATIMAPRLDAQQLRVVVEEPGPPATEDPDQLEQQRQRAVDQLGILDTVPEERFDRIVALAKEAFQTDSAAFAIIDRDRQWYKSRIGLDEPELPRSMSFCAVAIWEPELLVVGDARADERFRDYPVVTGEPFVRFYAGFPVESPSGHRIGALCVFDSKPRDPDTVNAVLLRQLALLVQKELRESPDPVPLN
ncbi:MAG TPA: GAF domain-containing protein [Galbitalea sp.]